FAVVENLQQVKMLRSNVSNVKEYFNDRDIPALRDLKGAWGMVLAPTDYFQRKVDLWRKSLSLIDYLARTTDARIMLVSSDNIISNGELRHVGDTGPNESHRSSRHPGNRRFLCGGRNDQDSSHRRPRHAAGGAVEQGGKARIHRLHQEVLQGTA